MNLSNRPKASTVLAVAVAGIATVNAYQAMVAFAIDMVGMDPNTAYVTAGVFELSLFTVAVLAREAAKDNRPAGVLLTLTWVLSGASGVFAAIHEYDLGHGVGATLFRLSVPVLAALMWHLALIGERHLATGTTWADARRDRAMQALYEAAEEGFRLSGTNRAAAAQRAFRKALHKARRVTPPTVMIHQTQQWDAASAAETATIITARSNHARQMAAFTNQPIEAPRRPVAVPTPPADITPSAPAPVATVTPAPRPVAAVPVPVYAQTAAATNQVHATVTAAVADSDRKCLGCGAPLAADAPARARYCSRTKTDGTRDQSCKNKHHADIRRAKSQRATLAATVDAMTQQRTAAAAFA